MTEVSIDVGQIPSIPDESFMESLDKNTTKCVENTCISCRHCYQQYGRLIILGVVLSILGVVVAVIVLSQKTNTLPCFGYDTNTPASSVSVKCLQYLWDTSCGTKAPYTFSPTYQGWWNQSPQGAILVNCHTNSQCGVGSYGNIAIYMGLCNIMYGQ
jgi:hypothetical protein